MASENVLPPSLPQTVAARRNARLRAAAIAAIPVLLFLLAAALRHWEPDLVPYGRAQAEYVAAASSRAPLSWSVLYTDLTVTPLTLVEPILRETPAPIVIWVVLRGLLDSLGVALLFLAARPLVGVWGGTLAALLYAVNPAAWAAARDPAGSLTAVVMAAALWAAVALVKRPTLLRGAIVGLMLGLLARSGPAGLIVVPLGAVALAFARAAGKVGGVTALLMVVSAGPALFRWLLPLSDQTFSQGYPLALPAWLIEGHLYARLSGWFPVSASQAQIPSHALSWAFSLTAICLLGAAAVTVLEARCGRTMLLLAPVWLFLWLVISYPRQDVDLDQPLTNIELVLSFRGPLALLPALALLLSVPMSSHLKVVRWVGTAAVSALIVAGAYSLGWELQAADRSERARQAFAEPPWETHFPDHPTLEEQGSLRWTPSLREVDSVHAASREAARRAGSTEIVRVSARAFNMLDADVGPLRPAGVDVREMTRGALVLPTERETVYLVSSGMPPYEPHFTELERPSSSTVIFTPDGSDLGARILTLRPRPAADWLARVTAVPNGRFRDGSVLLGVQQTRSWPGQFTYALYWELPAAADGRRIAEQYQVRFRGEPLPAGGGEHSQQFPPVEVRRAGELLVVSGWRSYDRSFNLDTPILVTLLDEQGNPIPRADGSTEIELPIRVQSRCDLPPEDCRRLQTCYKVHVRRTPEKGARLTQRGQHDADD